MQSRYAAADADNMLADHGEILVCADFPTVVLGIIESDVSGLDVGGVAVAQQQHVLKVKRGAFGTTSPVGVRLDMVEKENGVEVGRRHFRINAPVPHQASIFDWYGLSEVKPK